MGGHNCAGNAGAVARADVAQRAAAFSGFVRRLWGGVACYLQTHCTVEDGGREGTEIVAAVATRHVVANGGDGCSGDDRQQ